MKIRNGEGNKVDKTSQKWGLLLICGIGFLLGAIGQIYDGDFVRAEAELKEKVKGDQASKFELLWGR